MGLGRRRVVAKSVKLRVGRGDNEPKNRSEPFLPVRASASRSLADSLNPNASSSSRYASRPASEVTTEPRK